MTVEYRRRVNGWWVYWVLITTAVALVVTLVDAALLQRKWNYFTGGFLAVEHLEGMPQALGFLVGSLAADGATAAMVVAIVLSLTLWLHLPRLQIVVITMFLALCPFAVADVVGYSILSFLGQTFDLQLMFDLSGRNPWELLAVTQAHLANAAWVGVPAVVVSIWLGVIAVRRTAKRLSEATIGLTPPHLLRAVTAVGLLLLFASATTVAFRMSSDVLDAGLKRKPSIQALSMGISWLSDVDRDGYGILGQVSDPAPFDSRIYPYALDIPGNGLDEDAVAGDLPRDAPPYQESPISDQVWRRKPNIVLIMLESVRADIVGSTLAGRQITPSLDAIANTGIRVQQAFSHNGYTVQSRQHTFSGSLGGVRGTSTLIDDFRAHGYEVGYFSGQDESFGGADGDVGFERADVAYDARQDIGRRYSVSVTPGSLAVPLDVVLGRVEQFLTERKREKPLFLYVNLHDTHFPYHHPGIQPILDAPVLSQGEIAASRATELGQMYANTVANVDRAIGRLLALADMSLGAMPAVIVLSDHGESLFDQGFLGHGYDLADAQTRIPLIVSGLPMIVHEPFGESDLRDAIIASVTRATDDGTAPMIRREPGREVFQYLGRIDDPAQIGLRSLAGLIAYDFRSRRARVGSAPWTKPSELDPAQSETFHRLVQTWERVKLARAAAAGHQVPLDKIARAGP